MTTPFLSGSPRWDPQRYLTYADERGRPFLDLLARIPAQAPATVIDLGCGPGNLTALLARRWPDAAVVGIDSSPEMIATARAAAPGIDFAVGDLRDWVAAAAPGSVDVLLSNATLQWVPDHLELLPALVAAVRPGGWLAFGVPGNMGAPSHRILDELAATAPYDAHTAGTARVAAAAPADYLRALRGLGCTVDAWETTYLHVLTGEDPVFTWISGTGARPVLAALPADLRADFVAAYRERLDRAYPAEEDGSVIFPFRRTFVVARIAGGER